MCKRLVDYGKYKSKHKYFFQLGNSNIGGVFSNKMKLGLEK